jgi:hypothetical protein
VATGAAGCVEDGAALEGSALALADADAEAPGAVDSEADAEGDGAADAEVLAVAAGSVVESPVRVIVSLAWIVADTVEIAATTQSWPVQVTPLRMSPTVIVIEALTAPCGSATTTADEPVVGSAHWLALVTAPVSSGRH